MNMGETNTFGKHSDTESRSKAAEHALLTLERAQKFDLLNHLINNLQQSLVICGPEGIGKTTLLEYLMENKPESWQTYFIKGNEQLSFDRIKAELTMFVQKSSLGATMQDVGQILSAAEKQNQKYVFIIDDAGALAPGVIDALCQYAASYSALRLVFALTPDELHIRTSSDKDINGCHFIDIPPLTELQCGGFLKNLAGKSGAALPIDEITSPVIKRIYRESHGIPGKIIAMQKGQITIPMPENQQWLYALAAGIFIAAMISFFLWGEDSEEPGAPVAKQTNQPTKDILAETERPDSAAKNLVSNETIESLETTKVPPEPEMAEVDVLPGATKQSKEQETFVEGAAEIAENALNSTEGDSLVLKELVAPPEHLKLLKENQNEDSDKLFTNQTEETLTTNVDTGEPKPESSEATSSQPSKPEQKNLSTNDDSFVDPNNEIANKAPKPLVREHRKNQQTKSEVVSSPVSSDGALIPEVKDQSEHDQKSAADKREITKATSSEPEKPRTVIKETKNLEPKKTPADISKSEKAKPDKAKLVQQVQSNKKPTKNIPANGKQWVLAQNPGNYSLQLMAVVKDRKATLLKTINKFPELKDKLHYFPSTKKGKKMLVLVYGSFASQDEAKKAAKTLPKKFGKPWLRSFKLLHKEIKASN